jgi:hypothetical protein
MKQNTIVLFLVVVITSIVTNLNATEQYTYSDFINALVQVESSGRDDVVGDNGKAVGCLQLWKLYVDDVNRICKLRKSKLIFKYNDRYDRVKSVQMTTIYLSHYVGNTKDYEKMARVHNGGPNGHNKQSTLKYWIKVKKAMKYEEKS